MPVKGIFNFQGENNCFLNCVIQILWNLEEFRNEFLSDTSHFCSKDMNVEKNEQIDTSSQDCVQGEDGMISEKTIESINSNTNSDTNMTSDEIQIGNGNGTNSGSSTRIDRKQSKKRIHTLPKSMFKKVDFEKRNHRLYGGDSDSNSNSEARDRKRELQKRNSYHGSSSVQNDSKEQNCIYCALKEIFVEYSEGRSAELCSDPLRIALSSTYETQSRFQLKQMDDAAEAYEAIVQSLHDAIQQTGAHASHQEICLSGCIVHQTLSNVVQEYNSSEEPSLLYNQFVQYVSVVGLGNLYHSEKEKEREREREKRREREVEKENQRRAFLVKALELEDDKNSFTNLSGSESNFVPILGEDEKKIKQLNFSQMIQKVVHENSPQDKNGNTIFPHIKNQPKVFTLGLIWKSHIVSDLELESLLDTISPVINFEDIFYLEAEPQENGTSSSKGTNKGKGTKRHKPQKQKQAMILRGMVCYYGHHYVTILYNRETSKWVLFDDTVIKTIGSTWNDLVTKCLSSRLQPSLLFYQQCTKEVSKEENRKFLHEKKAIQKSKRNSQRMNHFRQFSDISAQTQEFREFEDSVAGSQIQNEDMICLENIQYPDDESYAKALQAELNRQARTTPVSPSTSNSFQSSPSPSLSTSSSNSNARSYRHSIKYQPTLMDRQFLSLLNQQSLELLSNWKQGYLLVKNKSQFTIPLKKRKGKLVVFNENFLYLYNPLKPIGSAKFTSLDLRTDCTLTQNEKLSFTWNLKFPNAIYEFSSTSQEVMESWIILIQNVLSAKEVKSSITRKGTLILFNDERYDLRDIETKEEILTRSEKQCICGRASSFVCECQVQGYCSSHCQIVHEPIHTRVCLVFKKVKNPTQGADPFPDDLLSNSHSEEIMAY